MLFIFKGVALKAVLIISISSLVSFTSCIHTPRKIISDDLVPLPLAERVPAASDIEWWAANERQVQNATCRAKLPVSTTEIEKYYKQVPLGQSFERGSFTVAGIELINERPQLVLALSKLLTEANEYESPRNVPKNFQKKFQVNPDCTKALCAAEKIFGKDVGPQMIFLSDKFDVNTSPYSFTNADTFNASEIADVIRTFELIHPDQSPFKANQKLIRFKRGYTRASYASQSGSVLANDQMELFDSWSNGNSFLRQSTLYHEFAHNHSNNQFSDYDRSASWLKISGWEKSAEGEYESFRKNAKKGHPFVSKYGETNPFEDFAESIIAYRFNPQLLKKKSEEKYRLIKLYVYDGLEFGRASECQKPTELTQIQEKIKKDAGALNELNKRAIKNSCRKAFYQSFLGNSPLEFFNSCVDYEATLAWQENNINKFPDLVPQSLFDAKLRISNLKFKRLRSEIASQLTPEAADWLLEYINYFSRNANSQMSNQEYCENWTELTYKEYPRVYGGAWDDKSVFSNRDTSPRADAVRGVCLDLVRGFIPNPKSSVTTIKDWLNTKLEFDRSTVDRGISRKKLLEYIFNRTQAE